MAIATCPQERYITEYIRFTYNPKSQEIKTDKISSEDSMENLKEIKEKRTFSNSICKNTNKSKSLISPSFRTTNISDHIQIDKYWMDKDEAEDMIYGTVRRIQK